jgi:hypothetical protein
MSNRTFALSAFETTWLNSYKSGDWESLIKKFSGRRLFTYNYFNLLNGDTSVLINNNNRWLIENILSYSASKQDKNFVSVLKKIADDNTLDEGIRRRSAMILEMPWIENNSFTGTRAPQTSEILKLLKVNSVESKRLAICMIGKFKLTDMLQEVADNLHVPGLEIDSAAVLQAFGNEVGNVLRQLYLKSSGNINTCKAILRILCRTGIQENITFLFERLWSNSKEIKEVALGCLINSNFKVPVEEKGRINLLICEITGLIVWLLSAQVYLRKSGAEFLEKQLNKEILQWKGFLFGLQYITYDSESINNVRSESSDKETDISLAFPELFNIIFNKTKKSLLWNSPRFLSDEKMLMRLHKFFPDEIPDYKNIIEELLNRSYNQISIWTKVCALRNVQEIRDDNLNESIAALMFSPEEILREEAAKLVAGTSMELYKSVSRRIPASNKARLDKIINKETHEMELLYEKTNFLSTLFPEIPEDKLLFLARDIKYMKNFREGFSFYPGGLIMWVVRSDLKIPDLVKVLFEDNREFNSISLTYENSFVYLLPLKTIEEFHYLFPEHSFAVLKYIDDNEESES